MISKRQALLRTALGRGAALAALAAFASAACAAPVAAADSTDPFAAFASLPTVGDGTLSTMRGRYVLPGRSLAPGASSALNASSTALARSGDGTFTASTAQGDSEPGLDVTGGGRQVVYFGVQMTSQWSVNGPNGTQGVQIGASLGINLQTQTVTISNWTGSINGGLPAGSSSNGSINGTAPAQNVANGVGQSIQVAGNGNTVQNSADLVVSTNGPTLVITPTSTACIGATCTTTVGTNALGISITTGQGVVSQSIGPNGALQSVQLNGNMNQIVSQMNMQAQMAPVTAPNAGSILPILQTLNGLP